MAKYPVEGLNLENTFTYHPPHGDQPARYEEIREAGKNLARVIAQNTPPGADQWVAIRHVRDACMTANAAIAINEKPT